MATIKKIEKNIFKNNFKFDMLTSTLGNLIFLIFQTFEQKIVQNGRLSHISAKIYKDRCISFSVNIYGSKLLQGIC